MLKIDVSWGQEGFSFWQRSLPAVEIHDPHLQRSTRWKELEHKRLLLGAVGSFGNRTVLSWLVPGMLGPSPHTHTFMRAHKWKIFVRHIRRVQHHLQLAPGGGSRSQLIDIHWGCPAHPWPDLPVQHQIVWSRKAARWGACLINTIRVALPRSNDVTVT